MGLLPEKEKPNIIERPDEASPLRIERKEVATPVPTHFKAQVHDDSGKPVITTPQTKSVTITIPAANKEELEKEAKSGIEESSSWSALYWLRMILKSIHKGIEFIFSGGDK